MPQLLLLRRREHDLSWNPQPAGPVGIDGHPRSERLLHRLATWSVSYVGISTCISLYSIQRFDVPEHRIGERQ